jgi:Domain of unknown function (DUF4082)
MGLYFEHDLPMEYVSPSDTKMVQRVAWQRKLVSEIESYVGTLYRDAKDKLGTLITGSGTRFFVFNSLNWIRSEAADYEFTPSGSFHIIDVTSGVQVPSQLVTSGGKTYVRILASDIPALGYRVYEIREGQGVGVTQNISVQGDTIENETYRVAVAGDGSIYSFYDKVRGQELAKSFNSQWLNDLGGTGGSLTIENSGPVSATILASSTSPIAHTSRITLYRGVPRVDIENVITQGFTNTQKFNFGFNLTAPNVWHEEVGAILRARTTTQGGHYSPKGSRNDWITLNHFMDMQGQDGTGVILSNADAYFMKLGSSTVSTLDLTTPRLDVLAGGIVGFSGLPNQAGDTRFTFRFSLQSYKGNTSKRNSLRFSLEHQNPLVTATVKGIGLSSEYPAQSYSAFNISNPDVFVWSLKPAEDGSDKGLVIRFWNIDNTPKTFRIGINGGVISDAVRLSHIETPEDSLSLSNGLFDVTVAGNGMSTVSFLPQLASTIITATPTRTFSPTSTIMQTPVVTVTQTPIRISTPTLTLIPTVTKTPIATSTYTKIPTVTKTSTATPSQTPSSTSTSVPVIPPTVTPTIFSTIAVTISPTATPSSTPTSTNTVAYFSLWKNTEAPKIAAVSEALGVELGLKFRSNMLGLIHGVRFYKGAENLGTHVGSLWSASGKLLARGTFTNETDIGWQYLYFNQPVQIKANKTYVVSYYAPQGHYAFDKGYFYNYQKTNGSLTALSSGSSGGNGVYRYGSSSAFPSASYNGTNYWVFLQLI